MLHPTEIQNIALLLLSPDAKNIALALELLEHHPYSIPQILHPVEVFLAFHPEQEALRELVETNLPNYSFLDSPIYLLQLIQQERYYPQNRNFLNRFVEQGDLYEKWIVLDPSRAQIYDLLAKHIMTHFEDHVLAIHYWKLAISYLPEDGELYFSIAKAYYFHFPKAKRKTIYRDAIIEAWTKAYELKPRSATLLALAKFYHKDLKDPVQAEMIWEKALANHPNDIEVLSSYASYCRKSEQWDKAKALAERSWQQLKTTSHYKKEETLYNLGYIEWKGFQNYAAAEEYFSLTLEENEYYLAPLQHLLDMFEALEDFSKVIKWLKKLLALHPDDPTIMLQLADNYYKIQDEEQAAYYYNEILTILPNYGPAQEGLDRLKYL